MTRRARTTGRALWALASAAGFWLLLWGASDTFSIGGCCYEQVQRGRVRPAFAVALLGVLALVPRLVGSRFPTLGPALVVGAAALPAAGLWLDTESPVPVLAALVLTPAALAGLVLGLPPPAATANPSWPRPATALLVLAAVACVVLVALIGVSLADGGGRGSRSVAVSRL